MEEPKPLSLSTKSRMRSKLLDNPFSLEGEREEPRPSSEEMLALYVRSWRALGVPCADFLLPRAPEKVCSKSWMYLDARSSFSEMRLNKLEVDPVGERRARCGMLSTGSSSVGSEEETWKVAPLDNDILRGGEHCDCEGEEGEEEVAGEERWQVKRVRR